MTRAIDNANGIWATGTPNYAAGVHPWSGTTTVNPPVYNFFTPGTAPAAQEFNSLLNSLTTAYDALVTWVATSPTVLSPAGLTAMTDTVVAGETRYIPNYGLYQYHTSAVVAVTDGLQSVAGHAGGVTQWVLADYNTRTPLLVNKQIYTFNAAALNLATGFNTTDPAARNAGNKGQLLVPGGMTFTVIAGDIFDISYTVNIAISAGSNSDVVTGVRYDTATYIADSIDNSAQTTGAHANGVVYGLASDVARVQITRHCYWQATVTGSKTFQLDTACDTDAHGLILQGSNLTILQYRPCPG